MLGGLLTVIVMPGEVDEEPAQAAEEVIITLTTSPFANVELVKVCRFEPTFCPLICH